MQLKAVVYGRPDCGICNSAAEKFERMDIPFTKEVIDYYTDFHEGWREDGSVEIMTAMCNQNKHIPVIKLEFGDDDAKYTSYVEAMRIVKDLRREMDNKAG